jgi:hypothetical protein
MHVPTDRRSLGAMQRPWRVLLLGVLVVLTLAILVRYRPIECHTQFQGSWIGRTPIATGGQGPAVSGGCYVLDRWTGRVSFRLAFDEDSAVTASETPLERLRRAVDQ